MNPKTGRIDLRIGADDCLYKSTAYHSACYEREWISRKYPSGRRGRSAKPLGRKARVSPNLTLCLTLIFNSNGDSISTLDNVHVAQAVAAVKAAVEPQIEKLCENKLLFKDSEKSRRDTLDAVYDIYRKATINNGVKMWRAWDTFDKDTHTCTISVEVFAGKEKVTIKHVVGPKQ